MFIHECRIPMLNRTRMTKPTAKEFSMDMTTVECLCGGGGGGGGNGSGGCGGGVWWWWWW